MDAEIRVHLRRHYQEMMRTVETLRRSRDVIERELTDARDVAERLKRELDREEQ